MLPNTRIDNIQEILSKANINIIWQIISGQRYDYDGEKFTTIVKTMNTFSDVGMKLSTGLYTLSTFLE